MAKHADSPLRIAMVVPGFPVLSQTFVALQIAELVARGHSVDIFSLGRRGKSSWLPSEARPRLEAIRVVHTGTPGRKRKWNVFLIPRLLSLLASKPGAVRSALTGVLLRRGFAAFSKLVADAHSMKDLSTYDLVHCQFATLAHRVLDLDATGMLETCPPVFCSVRGYDITSERHIAKARWSEVIDFVDRFLPVSRSLEARLVDLGCRVPISIVHSPVNTTRLLEAKPSGTAGGREATSEMSCDRCAARQAISSRWAHAERARSVDADCGSLRGSIRDSNLRSRA
jgi:hypothetical protein